MSSSSDTDGCDDVVEHGKTMTKQSKSYYTLAQRCGGVVRHSSMGALDQQSSRSPTKQSSLVSSEHSLLVRQRSRSQNSPALCRSSNGSPLCNTTQADLKMQMIIIGDRGVGKTCFLERYIDDVFRNNVQSTVGIDFKMKTLIVSGQKVRMQIWDTAGQERFNSITTAYYRNAQGIMLLYDVTNRQSYQNMQKWLDLIREFGRQEAEIVIVGNKADIPSPEVRSDEAKQFAEAHGYLFYETSAKNNLNVDQVFVNLIYRILRQLPEDEQRPVKRKVVALHPWTSDRRRPISSSCC